MNMKMNYYFDQNYWYTYSLPSGEGDCPIDAVRKPLPPKPWEDGKHPKFNQITGDWNLETKE